MHFCADHFGSTGGAKDLKSGEAQSSMHNCRHVRRHQVQRPAFQKYFSPMNMVYNRNVVEEQKLIFTNGLTFWPQNEAEFRCSRWKCNQTLVYDIIWCLLQALIFKWWKSFSATFNSSKSLEMLEAKAREWAVRNKRWVSRSKPTLI